MITSVGGAMQTPSSGDLYTSPQTVRYYPGRGRFIECLALATRSLNGNFWNFYLFLVRSSSVALALRQSESEVIPSVLSCALLAADMLALGVCGSVTRGRDLLALGWSVFVRRRELRWSACKDCLLYTSDAADE